MLYFTPVNMHLLSSFMKRNNKSLTISSINKSEMSEANIRLSNDDPRRREYSDNGFEEIFDIAKDPYRQGKK